MEHAPQAIYHVALAADWREAQAAGVYTVSTRGASLDEVGFVHCAFREQIEGVGERFYGDVPEPLVVLVIDVGRLDAEVRVEPPVGGGDERFPHVYGPVTVRSVRATLPAWPTTGGGFTVGWGLAVT